MYGVEGTCREKMLVVESYEVRRMYIWNNRPTCRVGKQHKWIT